MIVDGERPSIDYAQRDDPRPVGNDVTFSFLPRYLHVSETVARTGRLPLWDAAGFGGRPLVGNPQGGLFYPPVWLAWIVRSPAMLGWLTIGHLLWGGLGVYVLTRGLGLGRWPATVAAGCFEAAPYLLAQTVEGHYPHVWAASWYPWAFWAFDRHRRGRPWGTLALPPILALDFLTGHPQEWYYLVLALEPLGPRRRLSPGQDRLLAEGRGGTGALGEPAGPDDRPGGGGADPRPGRAGLDLADGPDGAPAGEQVSPPRDQPGATSRSRCAGGPAGFFGDGNYWETLLSIGIVPLVLATIALARHPDRTLVRGWAALTLLSVLFAAGHRFGVFAVLFTLVPGMDRFRVPARSLFLANLGAAVLCGLGVETLLKYTPLGDAWRGWSGTTGWGQRPSWPACSSSGRWAGRSTRTGCRRALAPRPSGTARPGRRPERVPGPRVSHAAPGSCTAACSGSRSAAPAPCSLLGRSATATTTRRGTVAAACWGAWHWSSSACTAMRVVRVAPAERFLGRDPISTVLRTVAPDVSGPVRIRARDTLYPDIHAFANGIEKINVNDGFQLQHAADLYQTLYPLLYRLPPPDPDEPMSAAVAQFRREVRQAVLDRLNVAFLVSDHIEPEPSWPLVATGVWNGNDFAIHRNPSALPRAYVVPRARPGGDDAATVLVAFRRIDPREAVVMPSDPLGTDRAGPRQPFTPAAWRSSTPDRVVLEVTTEAPGLLVVADTWMPGWTAIVDGRPAPILRGNHAQRVIPLPDPGAARGGPALRGPRAGAGD